MTDNINPSANPQKETKICSVCGRELPITSFKMTRKGDHCKVCRDCVASKYQQTLAEKRAKLEAPYTDPEFDGLDPRVVVDKMIRCRRWLERKGFEIELSCKYTETKVHIINCK